MSNKKKNKHNQKLAERLRQAQEEKKHPEVKPQPTLGSLLDEMRILAEASNRIP